MPACEDSVRPSSVRPSSVRPSSVRPVSVRPVSARQLLDNYLTSTLAYNALHSFMLRVEAWGSRWLRHIWTALVGRACLQGHSFAVFHIHSLILTDSQLLQHILTLIRFCAGSTRFLPMLRQLAVTSRPAVISHAKALQDFFTI
jgi:hypothetical protein